MQGTSVYQQPPGMLEYPGKPTASHTFAMGRHHDSRAPAVHEVTSRHHEEARNDKAISVVLWKASAYGRLCYDRLERTQTFVRYCR